MWLLDGRSLAGGELPIQQGFLLRAVPPPAWTIAAIGDFDRDGRDDLVWRSGTTGEVRIWYLDASSARADVQSRAWNADHMAYTARTPSLKGMRT